MITRYIERRAKRIPGQPWTPPVSADTLRYECAEGTITESVHGNRVRVTVKLCRTWAVLLGEGTTAEFREALLFLIKLWRFFDCACKIAICVAVLYLGYEICSAFLPGGAVDRVIERLP